MSIAVGQRFGWLVVEEKAESKGGRSRWLCQCGCGKKTIVISCHLTKGHTVSCGCKKRTHNPTFLVPKPKPAAKKKEGMTKQRLCKCGNPLPPRVHSCDACKEAKFKAELEAARVTVQPAPKAAIAQVEMFKPWTPRPKPAPLMTDAEQRAIDAAVDRALFTRCGYGHGPARKLTREEIAAVAHTLTPIEQIPTPDVTPWALKGVVI